MISWRLNVSIKDRQQRSSFKSAWFEPYNHYTTALLVINQAQFDWPRQEGCSYKQIKEHMLENINAQSKIANMNDMNIQRGFKNSVLKD